MDSVGVGLLFGVISSLVCQHLVEHTNQPSSIIDSNNLPRSISIYFMFILDDDTCKYLILNVAALLNLQSC